MECHKKKKNGFTLAELLIVIAIILILISVSIFALNDQQAKARDAKRISDIRQISHALEFYYSNEGEYPVFENSIKLGSSSYIKLCSKIEGGFVSADTSCAQETTYISQIPVDPKNNNYIYQGYEKGYDLSFRTEKNSSLGSAGLYHAHSYGFDRSAGLK